MAAKFPYGKGPVKLVSTEWLGEQLGSDKVTILDVQPNIHDYVLEHIPGAFYLNEGHYRHYHGNLPALWIEPQEIEQLFNCAGIRPDLPVVVYTGKGAYKGWGDGLEQTMTAYTLIRYGHDNVYVLDGGLDKWKAEGRALSKEYPALLSSDFKARVQRDFFVDYAEFKALKDREDVVLLDARPPDVYEGQGPWSKPGHIPGAVSLPWASLMEDNNKAQLKPEDEILKKLSDRNVTPDKTIICSCGTGREATNEFLLLKCYLGYEKVKLHEGAFTEWASYPENPTVTGKNPR
jgi:thiosulfate/3-mercaptopyruvate sulfurtransferase